MRTELLAPAGDIEAAYSAFYFGADAIYLGLRQFSARAEATNFLPEELDEIVAFAHAHGKKVYVTVNTVIQEAELSAVLDTLTICAKCHADAVIVQDWGVARLVRTLFPELELYASTQMAIHNLAGALAMKRMGFKRVVPARELTLAEIREIYQKSGLDVEVFIHGALCYSYSGLCLFSSLETGRSANRGKCVYSCRNLFRMSGREYHPFSMKDLALEKDVTKLDGFSLKIEGRKKNALYVGAVVDYYRRILDTGKADARLTDNLKQIFARPWTKLHLNGKNKDVIDPDFVGHRGLMIGRVDKVFNHTITFSPNRPIARYDGIQIDIAGQEKPFGFSAEQMRVAGKNVFEASAGQVVTMFLPPHHPFIRKGDSIYLASSTRVKGSYRYEKPRPGAYKNRQAIDIDVFLEPDSITACCGEKAVTLPGPFSAAEQAEKVVDSVRRAFDKTGDTSFVLRDLSVHNTRKLFAPASVLNELRRQLYAQIQPLSQSYQLPQVSLLKVKKQEPLHIIKTDDLKLAESFFGYDELIYVLSETDTPETIACLPREKLRLALPTILRPEKPWHSLLQAFMQSGYHRWEIGNSSGLNLLSGEVDITLSSAVSMMNTQAIEEALAQGIKRITFSPEDTMDNIQQLAKRTTQTVLVLYQTPPLFLSANCVRENACQDCPRGRLEMSMNGGKGRYRVISENCQTVVINELPLALPPVAQTIPVSGYQIEFCHRRYTPDEAAVILDSVWQKQKIRLAVSGNFEKQFAK